MKILDIIKSIDVNDETIQNTWNSMQKVNENVFQNYDYLNETEDHHKRIKTFNIKTWLCTDTHVGIVAYFLDDEFAFIEVQNSRKGIPDYQFASKKMFDKVEKFIESMRGEDEVTFTILNKSQVLEDEYFNEYAEQYLHNYAFYNGEIVDIINRFRNGYEGGYNFHNIEIKHANGKREVIDCRDLRLKICTPYKREDYKYKLI